MQNSRLETALNAIDALNQQDPHAREHPYAQQLTDWALRLDPKASEPLRIAARGQHVQRWTIPRDRFPLTRAGYLKWRETLKNFHADTVAKVMHEAGYEPEIIERVRQIIHKRNLKTDADTQTLEDALCLVFLETQLADLRAKTPDEKMAEVIRKTWDKMSPRARQIALTLPLSEQDRAFVQQSLA